jgi:hypothetical protein
LLLLVTPSPLYRIAIISQPFCALLAQASFFLPIGPGAAVLSAIWLAFSGLIALYGIKRLRETGFQRIDEMCIIAGLWYLPVGAIWLVFSRWGAMPFGFTEPIITLTAVHFHYAGFATSMLAAMAGRKLVEVNPTLRPKYRLAAWGVIGGPPLLAVGITFSPAIEMVAALWLAASLALLALLVLFAIVPRAGSRPAQLLLVVSSCSALAAMAFAALYAVGAFTGSAVIDISQMVRLHGLLNSLGFVICGSLAWRLIQHKAALSA